MYRGRVGAYEQRGMASGGQFVQGFFRVGWRNSVRSGITEAMLYLGIELEVDCDL